MNLPFCVGSYVVRACSCANPESASMSLVTWNSLLKMGKIVLSHFHMWCLHRCGARKKGAGGEDLVSACSHTYIWICTRSSWRRRWGRVCQAFQAQIWKAWCAACFIQRARVRWFSNKRKNVFSTVESLSALILVAGCMLMERRVFSLVLLLLTQPVTFKVSWSTQCCLWAILQPNYSSPWHNPRKALNDALSNAAASATCGSSSRGCLTAGSSLCFAVCVCVSRREGHVTCFYGDHGKEG